MLYYLAKKNRNSKFWGFEHKYRIFKIKHKNEESKPLKGVGENERFSCHNFSFSHL